MDILIVVFSIIVLIVSIIFHELAHGTMADLLGDPTPRLAGRLTLNPLAHMEWVGSFIVPLLCILSGTGFIIGWAKPVPFNDRLLKYPRIGPALVAIAGPLINIIFALVAALAFHILKNHGVSEQVLIMPARVVMVNIALAIFNLVPIPPLDGHHILGAIFPKYRAWSNSLMRSYGLVILVIVIFFAGSIISPAVLFFNRLLLG